jgi:tetratricopeptide (TPR) repeat protein
LAPNWLKENWYISNLINYLPAILKKLLAWCSICSYFDRVILDEILAATGQEVELSDELWYWIIELPITQKFSSIGSFYKIKHIHKIKLRKYLTLDIRSAHLDLANFFDRYMDIEIDPKCSSFYKAAKTIHLINSGYYDLTIESITDVKGVFYYEKDIANMILNSLSKQLNTQKVRWIYQVALSLPRRKNIDYIFIFPIAVILEKLALKLRPRKLTVLPLYISSLVYQTWSNHEKAIQTLCLAINHIPYQGSALSGVLSSRLALSYIMLGDMNKAQESLLYSSTVLSQNSNEWIDNRLNNQIWCLKRGYWQDSLQIGKLLEGTIQDQYLKAKHSHILGVTYLYLGDFQRAEEYAKLCEELSSLVTLSTWIIGKAWRNRFAYALLSSISLVRGASKTEMERDLHFNTSLEIAYMLIKQLNPTLRLILGCTIESHLLYTEASISAMKGDFQLAEEKYLKLQQDNHLEVYYKVSSKLDLASIYFKTDRLHKAQKLYEYCAELANTCGFKYLEYRALKKLSEIVYDEVYIAKMNTMSKDSSLIYSSCIENLEFLIPV